MSKLSRLCLLVSCLIAAPAASRWPLRGAPDKAEETRPALPPRYERWLDRDVHWLISDEEKASFLALTDDAERERFIESFWDARDPTPGTRRNEYRIQHYARLEVVERQLGRDSPRPAYLTDRGRAWILLGEPQDRKFFFSSAEGTYPAELWFYQPPKVLGLPSQFYLLFFKPHGTGEYRMYSPAADGPEALLGGTALTTFDQHRALEALSHVSLELARAAMSLLPSAQGSIDSEISSEARLGSDMLLARLADVPRRLVEARYMQRFGGPTGETHTEVAFAQFDSPPVAFGQTERDGTTWIHVAMEVPPDKVTLSEFEDRYAATVTLVASLDESADGSLAQFQRVIDIEMNKEQYQAVHSNPMAVQAALPCIPGRRKVHLTLRNEVSGQFGVGDAEVVVPEPGAASTGLSPLLLAHHVERNEAAPPATPFAFAGLKLYPAFGQRFARGESAFVYYQYRYAPTGAPGKLAKTLSLEHNGREVNGQLGFLDLDPERDHGVIHAVENVALKSLAPGAYDLTVRVTNDQGKVLGESRTRLEVVLDVVPRPWSFVKSGGEEPWSELGRQNLAVGKPAPAAAAYTTALRVDPGSAPARFGLAESLLKLGRASEVTALLAGHEDEGGWLGLSFLGASEMALKRYADAARHYRKALDLRGPEPRLLNALGEAYFAAGDPDKARECFARSLALDGSQAAVREALAKLGAAPEPATP